MEAFETQAQLAESIQAADPQLVLVFEALDEQIDLTQVARDLGLEILVESEGTIEPTEEYVLKSKAPRNPFIGSCLHAICLNQTTFNRLLGLWGAWKRDRALDRGLSPLRDLFAHLKDVRPWGPQDRLKMIDWDDYFAGLITDHPHAIEIELWYRRSSQARTDSQRDVTILLRQAGGQVLSSAIIDDIGYHGLKCTVPTSVLVDLTNGRFDAVQVVKSANVMYLRITGQAVPRSGPVTDASVEVDAPLPDLPPVVCLLDGVPAANHPLLMGRVVVHDPDDLASESTVNERKHGTWMSSVAVWGDLSSGEAPASRQVLVRPILTPSPETRQRDEELPASELTPDLMWRVFRELFDSDGGANPAAPQVAIVNLSVGDPATPFDSILSSWARMIDWLSGRRRKSVGVVNSTSPTSPRTQMSVVSSSRRAAPAHMPDYLAGVGSGLAVDSRVTTVPPKPSNPQPNLSEPPQNRVCISYDLSMSFSRITISVPEQIAAKAQRAVESGQAESVSGYFTGLAEREPDWAQARAVLDEMIEEAGGIPAEDRRWARSVLGLGDGDPR